jgi:hypothetical protein
LEPGAFGRLGRGLEKNGEKLSELGLFFAVLPGAESWSLLNLHFHICKMEHFCLVAPARIFLSSEIGGVTLGE